MAKYLAEGWAYWKTGSGHLVEEQKRRWMGENVFENLTCSGLFVLFFFGRGLMDF